AATPRQTIASGRTLRISCRIRLPAAANSVGKTSATRSFGRREPARAAILLTICSEGFMRTVPKGSNPVSRILMRSSGRYHPLHVRQDHTPGVTSLQGGTESLDSQAAFSYDETSLDAASMKKTTALPRICIAATGETGEALLASAQAALEYS